MSENEHYIKCPICWGEKLGELSDIKDNEKRFEKLNEFMQNIIEYDINESEKELIENFIKKIRHIPLFWVFEEELGIVYKAIDEIRDHYQKKLEEWK